MLERLPSRITDSAAFDQQVYFLALEGVTQHGLFEAVKFILRGALGHTFFPSPPELRLQCEKAMEWYREERTRIQRREQNEQERREHARPQTAEGRARVAEVYAQFCATYEKSSAEDTLKLDPELVAQVPDNPKSLAKTRMGKAP